MMAFDFPTNPKLHQEFTVGAATYIWDGAAWVPKGSPVAHVQTEAYIGKRPEGLSK